MWEFVSSIIHVFIHSFSWSSAKELVWEFVSSVLENGENLLSMQLFSKIQWLLEKTERKFQHKLEDRLLPLGEKERLNLGEFPSFTTSKKGVLT